MSMFNINNNNIGLEGCKPSTPTSNLSKNGVRQTRRFSKLFSQGKLLFKYPTSKDKARKHKSNKAQR